jgi:hypothetical protein
MTFYEVLDHVVTLLQQRGRVTYRALQRQFTLDGAYLDDLKAELIDGQQVARDEHGKVLVWTGKRTGGQAESGERRATDRRSADSLCGDTGHFGHCRWRGRAAPAHGDVL